MHIFIKEDSHHCTMSSQDVIKSTARKLKYYMDVKRLEDAFDLSGPDKPQRHYPTLKPRPTLMYDGLHDRALKHYFRSPEVKKHMVNMNPRQSHIEREEKVRKDVDNYMAKSHFTAPYTSLVKPKTSPKKRRSNFRGGPILMRSRHGPYLSKGETERLINAATRLLVASETVPLQCDKKSSKSSKVCRLPKNYDSELPQIVSSSQPTVPSRHPRRPDRPKSSYSWKASSRTTHSSVVGRSRSAGGRLNTEAPSSTRYGYDTYGQRVKIHTEVPRHYEASESETEDYEEESVNNGMTSILVPLSGSTGQQTPEWLNIQMSRIEVDDGIESDEEQQAEESDADAISIRQDDSVLCSLDMCTQTDREISTQTVEKPDNTRNTQTRRGNDEECMTDPYQVDMAVQTDPPPITLSTQTYDPPPTIATQTVPLPPTVSTQTYPEMSTQTTPVDNIETQTNLRKPPIENGIQVDHLKVPTDIGSEVEVVTEIGIQSNPPSPTPPPETNFDHLKHGPRLKSGKRAIYELAIHTGDCLGASTKADVQVVLYGERGNTGKIKLKQMGDTKRGRKKMKFQKGQIDVFKVESYNVGKIECISIGHDRNEIGYGWYLAKVMVRQLGNSITYEFMCDRWLSAQDKDGRTVRTLPVTNIIREVDDIGEDDDVEQSPDSSVYSDNDIHLAQKPDGHFVAIIPSEHASIASGRSRRSQREPESSSSESDSEEDAEDSGSEYSDSEDDSGSSSGSDSSTGSGSDSKSGSSRSDSDSDDREGDGNSKGGRSYYSGKYKDRSGPKDSQDAAASPPVYSDALTAKMAESTTGKSMSTSISSSRVISSPTSRQVSVSESSSPSESDSDSESIVESRSERTSRVGSPKGSRKDDKDNAKVDRVYKDEFKAELKASQEEQTQAKEQEDKERNKEEERVRQAEERLLQGPSMHESCKDGDLDRVKLLAQHSNELIETRDERGWLPLHVASSRGQLDIVKWLTANPVKLEELTPTGYTPMHMAAMNGHLNVMMILVAMGAMLSGKTVDEQTSLHLASMSGHAECCRWLVANHFPLDAVDIMGRTALDLAEEYNHDEVVALLKACKEEMTDLNGSLARLRSRSPDLISHAANPVSKLTDSEEWVQDSKLGDEGPSSRGEKHDNSADKGNMKNKKHLLVQRTSFQEQHKRMSRRGKSFLESIQDEIIQDTET